MSDNLNKKGPHDATKVNVHEAWEIKYWCEKFNCTENALKNAVNAVGVSAAKVKEWLQK